MQGNGTIQTPVNNELVNSGTINPGDGIGLLTIDGGLKQTSDGRINLELASLTSFDHLAITGDVMLGGEINVWNHGYAPALGDSFIVATFDDRLTNSECGAICPHDFGSGIGFKAIYNEHDVTLVVTVPEPEQYALLLAGLGLIGAMARRQSAKQ